MFYFQAVRVISISSDILWVFGEWHHMCAVLNHGWPQDTGALLLYKDSLVQQLVLPHIYMVNMDTVELQKVGGTKCLAQEHIDSGKVESYSFTPPPAAKPRWQFDTRAETDPPSVPRTQSPLQLYSTAVRTLQYHSEYFTTNDIHHNFETVHNIVLLSLWYYSTIAFKVYKWQCSLLARSTVHMIFAVL